MSKVVVKISDDETVREVLAKELDREDSWSEINSSSFKNNNIDGLTLEIKDDKYLYTLKTSSRLSISLVDIDTMKQLTDEIEVRNIGSILNDIINNKNSIWTDSNVTVKACENGNFEIKAYNDIIVIHITKLLSFVKNNNCILQLIM